MGITRVFVYGTLKPGERYYQRYCAGHVLHECRAIVYGRLYDLPVGYPAMTMGQSLVQGYVLSFAESKILIDLDDLEDYDAQRLPEDNLYERCWVEAFSPDRGSLGQVWAYRMRPDVVQQYRGVAIPDGCWQGTHQNAPPDNLV